MLTVRVELSTCSFIYLLITSRKEVVQVVHTVQRLQFLPQRTELCIQGDFFFYQLRENYTDRMTPYGILFTHNVFPLQAL